MRAEARITKLTTNQSVYAEPSFSLTACTIILSMLALRICDSLDNVLVTGENKDGALLTYIKLPTRRENVLSR